ncbi:MAG TPA: hypothetical protein VFT05_11665 [Burkholderiaceae bacterium]|nr:hypothetical protein [Burkholderiaceae bacterium]
MGTDRRRLMRGTTQLLAATNRSFRFTIAPLVLLFAVTYGKYSCGWLSLLLLAAVVGLKAAQVWLDLRPADRHRHRHR